LKEVTVTFAFNETTHTLDEGMGGLMDYKERFYSSYLNHFTQPDTLPLFSHLSE
jgi:hypothetical protein